MLKNPPGKQLPQLRVRPSDSVKKKLRAAAKTSGRTLSKEMEHRLAASFGESAGPSPQPFAAWAGADAEFARQLGEVVALLFLDVTSAAGTKTPHSERLGLLRPQIAELFDILGARVPSSGDFQYFAHRAHDLITGDHIKPGAEKIAFSVGESELGRLVRALREKTFPPAKR
jgi:hypothetical protein